jgi:hypothetical protein
LPVDRFDDILKARVIKISWRRQSALMRPELGSQHDTLDLRAFAMRHLGQPFLDYLDG